MEKNVQGKSNSKVIKKIQTRIKYDNYSSNVFYVMMKDSEWNRKYITLQEKSKRLMQDFNHECFTNGKAIRKILFKDGSMCEDTEKEYGL